MPTRIGLYYPYFHFRDDAWLKLAALYWDQMARIVPHSYQNHLRDSDTVKTLKHEANFIREVDPNYQIDAVGQEFARLVEHNDQALRAGYAVGRPNGEGTQWHGETHFPDLALIYHTKMSEELVRVMEPAGLAFPHRSRGHDWIAMHPRLASVYMTALAEALATHRGLYPVTTAALPHLGVVGSTFDRVAQALLGDVELDPSASSHREIEAQLAMISLRTLIPRDMGNVPVSKILELRHQHGSERSAFQDYIHGLASHFSQLEIHDPDVLQEHLALEYEQRLAPELKKLKDSYRRVNVETMSSAVNVLFTTGPGTIAGLLSPDLKVLGAGAIALGLTSVALDRRKGARGEAQSSPVASFLLRVDQGLEPTSLITQLTQYAARFQTTIF